MVLSRIIISCVMPAILTLVAPAAYSQNAESQPSTQSAFEEDWKRYQEERPTQRHFARSMTEIGLLLSAGAVWYWSNQDRNSGDWELKPTLGDVWKKLSGRALNFDNNRIYTNTFNHPFSGAVFYLSPRSNGYGAFDSFLFTLGASSVWEYLIEYPEKVSLNDQVFSSVGATAIGESIYQLGEFFSTSADNTSNGILKWILGAPQNFHRFLDGKPAKHANLVDGSGFRNDIWHQFELSSGVGSAGNRRVSEFGLETQIVHLPGYGRRAGKASFLADETTFSQMRLRIAIAEGRTQHLSAFMKAMFLGYYRQDFTRSPSGGLRGYSLLIGPASAFSLSRHVWSRTGTKDVRGIVNMLGPAMELAYQRDALRLRLTLDAYADLAAMHAFAGRAYRQVGSLNFAKSVLRARGYVHYLGLTTRARATLSYKQLELGASARYSYYDSIEGLDRWQDSVTEEVTTVDQLATLRTWLSRSFVNDQMRLGISYERPWRSGTASNGNLEVSNTEAEDRFIGSVLLRF